MKVIHVALLPKHLVFSIYYRDNNDAVECLNNNVFFKKTIYEYSKKTLRRSDLGNLVFERNICVYKQLNEYFKSVHSFIRDMFLVIFKSKGVYTDIKKYCILVKYHNTNTWKIGFTNTLESYKPLQNRSYVTFTNIGYGWIKFMIKSSDDDETFIELRDCARTLKTSIYAKLTLRKELIVCRGHRDRDFDERLKFLMTTH